MEEELKADMKPYDHTSIVAALHFRGYKFKDLNVGWLALIARELKYNQANVEDNNESPKNRFRYMLYIVEASTCGIPVYYRSPFWPPR
jgi:hypothetical protein